MSMAAKKPISEYGGKEKYASKAAKAKHEKGEGRKMEMKEKMMRNLMLKELVG